MGGGIEHDIMSVMKWSVSMKVNTPVNFLSDKLLFFCCYRLICINLLLFVLTLVLPLISKWQDTKMCGPTSSSLDIDFILKTHSWYGWLYKSIAEPIDNIQHIRKDTILLKLQSKLGIRLLNPRPTISSCYLLRKTGWIPGYSSSIFLFLPLWGQAEAERWTELSQIWDNCRVVCTWRKAEKAGWRRSCVTVFGWQGFIFRHAVNQHMGQIRFFFLTSTHFSGNHSEHRKQGRSYLLQSREK